MSGTCSSWLWYGIGIGQNQWWANEWRNWELVDKSSTNGKGNNSQIYFFSKPTHVYHRMQLPIFVVRESWPRCSGHTAEGPHASWQETMVKNETQWNGQAKKTDNKYLYQCFSLAYCSFQSRTATARTNGTTPLSSSSRDLWGVPKNKMLISVRDYSAYLLSPVHSNASHSG